MIDYATFERAVGQNWYAVDPDLQALLARALDPADQAWATETLTRIGALVGGPIAERGEVIDRNPPRLERYDRWGEEVNRVVHHPAALAAKRDCWEHGVTGARLEREAAARGRPFPLVLRAACNYLLSQADTGLVCATGMTAGVVGLVQRFAAEPVRSQLLARLTAERFDDAWDGAMFMTERTGGSDLSTLTTSARERYGRWVLDGFKFFCSNVDAGAIATLARPEGGPPGLKGVALFVVPRTRADGSPNGIRIHRLKDKLGTRTVPTGEVDFVDAEAWLLAGDDGAATDGRGINRMMVMVNESRLGIAAMGLGCMRRAFLEGMVYASHRTAFGHPLAELPLVRETLLRMLVDLEAAAALYVAAADAFDRDPALARILVPLVKMRATRGGIELASMALELHGGNGYMEDWPLARLLREAQCHTIWEGTENIICLDVLRALRGEGTAPALLARITAALRDATDPPLSAARATLADAAARVERLLAGVANADRTGAEYRARHLATKLCAVVQAALLLEHATWELREHASARKAKVLDLFLARHVAGDADAAVALEEDACRTIFTPLVGYAPIAAAARVAAAG